MAAVPEANIQVAREGREELELVYEKALAEFGDGLYRLASSYESVADAREDLLQEIRLALWKALPSFRGECSVRTFVYRVAHNRGLTHVWRRKAQAQASEDFPEPGDPRPDPERSAIRNADHESLMAAIRQLPVPYRQVITMALEELPQAEMAAVLGTSEGNIAVRLTRARKMLRQELGAKR